MVANEITIRGYKAPRGARMTKGRAWRLVAMKGRKRFFKATLLRTFNLANGQRIAMFNVPK